MKTLNIGPGTRHVLAGFTSTSTDSNVAKRFAENHAEDSGDLDGHRHIIKFHAHPGTALSVAPHSGHDEDEMVVNRGSHATYSRTTTEGNYKIHHMFLHSK